MEKTQRPPRIPGILLIVGSVIGVIFWFIMLFFAFFLGGSSGPDFGRTVPLLNVPIIGLGFAGAIIGLVAGIKSMRGANASLRRMVTLAALLGAAGSVPFFLLELTGMGLVALAFGIVSPAAYLFITMKIGGT